MEGSLRPIRLAFASAIAHVLLRCHVGREASLKLASSQEDGISPGSQALALIF